MINITCLLYSSTFSNFAAVPFLLEFQIYPKQKFAQFPLDFISRHRRKCKRNQTQTQP